MPTGIQGYQPAMQQQQTEMNNTQSAMGMMQQNQMMGPQDIPNVGLPNPGIAAPALQTGKYREFRPQSTQPPGAGRTTPATEVNSAYTKMGGLPLLGQSLTKQAESSLDAKLKMLMGSGMGGLIGGGWTYMMGKPYQKILRNALLGGVGGGIAGYISGEGVKNPFTSSTRITNNDDLVGPSDGATGGSSGSGSGSGSGSYTPIRERLNLAEAEKKDIALKKQIANNPDMAARAKRTTDVALNGIRQRPDGVWTNHSNTKKPSITKTRKPTFDEQFRKGKDGVWRNL